MSRRVDPTRLLCRAIEGDADRAGVDITIGATAARSWASATFEGARHRIALTAPATPALAAWLAALPDAELRVRGQLVADLIVTAFAQHDDVATVSLEALTVVET